jgi:hypothetical protein
VICDTSNLTFDISGSASLYSQMAGVLAAFAFGAIALVLPGDHKGRRSSADGPNDNDSSDLTVLLALVGAFMSLILATVEYAVLAGERGCSLLQGRAASEEFLGGVSFALAVMLLLFAVSLLVTNSRVPGAGYHARLIIAMVGPAISLLFLITGAEDVASTPWLVPIAGHGYLPQTSTRFYYQANRVALLLPALMFLFCGAMWILRRKFNKDLKGKRLFRFNVAASTSFPYVSLGLSVAAAVRAAAFSEADPSSHIYEWEVWTWLAVCTVVFAIQAVILAFHSASSAEPSPPDVARPSQSVDQRSDVPRSDADQPT